MELKDRAVEEFISLLLVIGAGKMDSEHVTESFMMAGDKEIQLFTSHYSLLQDN